MGGPREVKVMAYAVLFALLVLAVGLGYRIAIKKHPTDPHQDFFFELTRRYLPKYSEAESGNRSGGTAEKAGEEQGSDQEEPVHTGFV